MYRQSKKNLLKSNISSTYSHNMVNFGPHSSFDFFYFMTLLFVYVVLVILAIIVMAVRHV